MATMRTIIMNIVSTFHGEGARQARKHLIALDDSIRRSNSSLLVSTGRTKVLTTSMLALAPAVKTVGGVMAGTAAMSVAGFVAMGAAGGAYVGVMAATIKRTNEMRKAGDELSESQQRYVASTDKMREAWVEFLKANEDDTLTAAATYVDGLTAGVSRLNPIIAATHPIILRNADAWRTWMEGDGSKRFADNIVQYGVPALDRFEAAARNVLAALGIGFRTALGQSEGFASSILRASEAFRTWAEGGGFTRFFEWVKENNPAVQRFFDALQAALITVGKAMHSLGPITLELASKILELISRMDPDVIKAFFVAFLALKGIALVAAAVGALTGALTFILSPMGFVLLAVVGITAAFLVLWNEFEGFRKFWIGTWEIIKTTATGAKDHLVGVLSEFDKQNEVTGNRLHSVWNMAWDSIKNDVVSPALNTIKEELGVWGSAFKEDWNKMWGGLKSTLSEEWEIIKTDFRNLWNGLKTALREEWDMLVSDLKSILPNVGTTLREEWEILKTDWKGLWSGFKTALREEWDMLVADLKSILPDIGKALSEEEAAWEADWKGMWTGFATTMNEEKEILKADVQGMLTSIGTSISEEGAKWKADWDGIWSGVKNSLSEEWNLMKTDLSGSLSGVTNSLREEGAKWKADWDGIWSGVKNTLSEEWTNMKTDLGGSLDSVGTSLREEGAEWKADWSGLWNGVKNTLSEEWNNMKTNLGGILPSIGNSLREEGGIWKADWDGLWSGVTTTLREEWEEIKRETSGGIDAIGRFWEGLKQKIAGPVQWIVDVVWNNGLRAAWNWINDLWDGKDINPFVVKFAEGGGVGVGGGGGQQAFANGGAVRGAGTGTSDSINARLSHNEHVWTAREVAAAGGHSAVAHMRSAVLGGKGVRTMGTDSFAEGGGFLDDFFTGARNILSPGGALGLDGFNAAADRIRGTINSAGGFATKMVDMAKRLPMKALDKVVEYVRDKLTPKVSWNNGGGGGGGGAGHPGRLGWQRMWEIVRGAFPDAQLTSSYRPGDPGAHGKGEAIDVWWPEDSYGIHRMKRLSFWLADNYPTSTELIHTPGMNLRYGKPYTYNGATADSHYNHVHWAMSGNPDMRPASSSSASDGWRGLILQELAHFGQWDGLAPMVHRRLMQESGGNARAINNWDINARNGTPSKGLMQVIDPTFNAFKDTRWHPNDIWDPGANMHAAFRYAINRYGSLESAFNRPGGYYGGTLGARSGYHWVGERGPELVKFRGGEKVYNGGMLRSRSGSEDTRPVFNTGGAPLIDARGATLEGAKYLEENVLPELLAIAKTGAGKSIGR